MLGILIITTTLVTRMLMPPIGGTAIGAPAADCQLRCRAPICSMHETIGLTLEVGVPSGWLLGDSVGVTASDGFGYEIPVPDSCVPGDTLLYAEAVVPASAEPGDEIVVVVTDHILTQLGLAEYPEVEVPDGYEAGHIIIVLLGVNVDEAVDWDAAWTSFASQRATPRFYALLPLSVGPDEQRLIALSVLATLLACYGALHHALHAGAGLVLLPDGQFGVRAHGVLELGPVAQRYLKTFGS